jgi:hypothetical protein
MLREPTYVTSSRRVLICLAPERSSYNAAWIVAGHLRERSHSVVIAGADVPELHSHAQRQGLEHLTVAHNPRAYAERFVQARTTLSRQRDYQRDGRAGSHCGRLEPRPGHLQRRRPETSLLAEGPAPPPAGGADKTHAQRAGLRRARLSSSPRSKLSLKGKREVTQGERRHDDDNAGRNSLRRERSRDEGPVEIRVLRNWPARQARRAETSAWAHREPTPREHPRCARSRAPHRTPRPRAWHRSAWYFWTKLTSSMPDFAQCQTKTSRMIPVVQLVRQA